MYLIHYGEIALKGQNRNLFILKLINHLQTKFKKQNILTTIKSEQGKLIVFSDNPQIEEILANTFGIENFAHCEEIDLNLELIKQKTLEIIARYPGSHTFKIETKRSNKKFIYNSIQLNKLLGEFVLAHYPNLQVNLFSPDILLQLNINNNVVYISTQKRYSIGGLPVGSSGKILSLISGGIDSPVASYLMLKRGIEISFLHFGNNMNNNQGSEKIKQIINRFLLRQNKINLHFISFDKIKFEIVQSVDARYRMIIFKRSMLRVANIIAQKFKLGGIIVGDALAQVASQTLENLNVIYAASKLPIFSPLISFNKQEIINIAQQIGTYNFSLLPYEDLCTLIASNHPWTKGKLDKILILENKLHLLTELEELVTHNIISEIIK